MASFFKNLFRKESDSQPVPAASLTNDPPDHSRLGLTEIPEAAAVPPRSGLPQSSGGPFSAVSGRHMTARELAAFLPPTLLRFDGVNPDHPVPLPVDSLRQSMQAGRPTLRLSQIQAACPLLFHRAPQADEDVEVTLPLARVKGILENSGPVPAPANPFESLPAANDRPAPELANPFAAKASPPPFSPAGPAAPSNPFAANPVGPSASPFAAAVPPPALPANPPGASGPSPFVNMPPAALSPFAAEFAAVIPAPPAVSPFEAVPGIPAPPVEVAVAPQSSAAASPFLPVASAAPPPPETPAPNVRLAPSPPAFPDHPAVSSGTSAGEPTPAKPPSPFQVVQPGTFPVLAVQGSPGAPAADVPISPMQPQTFGLPVAMPSQSARVGAAPSAAVSPAPAVQGFPVAATQRTPAVPWTPPVSGAPPGNGAPLPLLPRTAPAPISSRFGPDPQPVLPSAPPPVKGAAFPSPFQAVHPTPAGSSPVFAPTPAPVSAPIPAESTVRPLIPTPATSPVSPVERVTAPIPAGTGGQVEMGLRAVLRDVDPARLGFAPENVPEAVRVAFPLDLVTCQLASGGVEVSVDAIRSGISEKFLPAFARAAADLKVVIPMSEVFHNLPESAKPALEPSAPVDSHLAITTSPFQTPFAIKAEEDRKQLLDLSATGFDPAHIAQRPATQPVPATELPPAPLPPVLPAISGAPTVQVELPPLRPAASAAPPASAESAPLPRPGLLSRPPGSGTAPIPPRTAPRLKPVPNSPTALRPFPKPPAPPETSSSFPPSVPPPAPGVPHNDDPRVSQPLAVELPPLMPSPPPVAPMAPPPLRPVEPELPDDLGESFSAARLGAEPPPRAGSAPVSLPVSNPGGFLPSPALESGHPLSLSTSVPVPLPVMAPPFSEVAEAGIAEWDSARPAPVAPTDLAPASLEPKHGEGTMDSPSVCEAVPPDANPVTAPVPMGSFAPAAEPPAREPILPSIPAAAITAPVPPSVTSPVEDLSFGCVSEIRQLILRAVLGTDQVLTPQDIVDRCANLSGIKACALLRQDNALVSQGMEAAEAASFQASAVQTRDSLLSLAESLGLGSGGNFTLRTDHGVRSFFLETGLCLAVWHEQPAFTPGTREKLILVTQELARD